jgi:nucleoside-diphosphate-sugar epimerase
VVKVLLTGASGYLGCAVAAKLVATGHQVVGLARSRRSAEQLRSAGMEAFRGDLTDLGALRAGVDRADAVVHAGFPQGLPPAAAARAEEMAVAAMLAPLSGTGRPFLYTSGVWVYGHTNGRTVTEASPLAPFPGGAWRARVEQMALAAADTGVVPVIARPGIVYGRGGSQMLLTLIAIAKQAGYAAYVGDGCHTTPAIHIDDLAQAYGLALERASAGAVLNLVDEAPTWKSMAHAIASAAGLPGVVRSIAPDQAQRQLGFFAHPMGADIRVDARRTRALLGWTPAGPGIFHDLTYGSYRTSTA